VVTSVALASMLPESPQPASPSRSGSMTTISRPTATVPPTSTAVRPALIPVKPFDLLQLARYEIVNAFSAPADMMESAAPIVSAEQPIPGQHLAIRMDWGGELPGPSQEASEARLLFAPASPTGTGSLPGNFEIRLAYRAGSIERSLFEDGREAGLSDPLILKLAEIFGWDIDFALDLRAGDRFVVIYEEKFWFGRKIADGAILAAEFWNRGRVYRAIGFRDSFGRINYFTPAGKSLRRPFLRTPVQFRSVSSRFSKSRYHPILKTWRAHTGVDYSAPIGTPVHATASGRVVSVGWNGGYGNTVLIDHGNSFSTLYAHLSRYRPGLRGGQHVEQGEVIGYVGQTGLATGPHLHYEFQVHGRHQNPLTFEFPAGETIAPTVREDFFRTARAWVARLDSLNGRYLAAR